MITVNGTIPKRIIPVQWNAKHPPLVSWKPFMDRDPTADEVAAWNRITRCNWMMITGLANGLVVLDSDPRRQGLESLRKHTVPITFTVRTPSGGFHYYFLCPPGGLATVKDFERGLEIRGDGAYVMIPPSSFNGVPYEIVCNAPAVPVPDWLFRLGQQTVATIGRSGRWREALGEVPQGRQHDQLVSLCGYIARTFPETLWPAIPEILWTVARRYPQDLRNPWTQEDMKVIAQSICTTEQRNRRNRIKVRVLE